MQTIKIVALAMDLRESEGQALLQKGFDAYITDASDITELIRRIEEVTAIIY